MRFSMFLIATALLAACGAPDADLVPGDIEALETLVPDPVPATATTIDDSPPTTLSGMSSPASQDPSQPPDNEPDGGEPTGRGPQQRLPASTSTRLAPTTPVLDSEPTLPTETSSASASTQPTLPTESTGTGGILDPGGQLAPVDPVTTAPDATDNPSGHGPSAPPPFADDDAPPVGP